MLDLENLSPGPDYKVSQTSITLFFIGEVAMWCCLLMEFIPFFFFQYRVNYLVYHTSSNCHLETKPSAKATESQISSKTVDEEIVEDSGLFCCPVDDRMKTYQRYSNLENPWLHRKYNLLDQAALLYAEKFTVGDSAQPTLVVQAEQCEAVESLQKGWAIEGSKKTARFTEDQRKYLGDKLRIGREIGHKADPEQVAQEMWYARNERGERRFKMHEFLTPGQIQSFLSTTAAKLRHAATPEDDKDTDNQAAEDEKAFLITRNTILMQCTLVHPIIYDTWNLCVISSTKKLLLLHILRLILVETVWLMTREKTTWANTFSKGLTNTSVRSGLGGKRTESIYKKTNIWTITQTKRKLTYRTCTIFRVFQANERQSGHWLGATGKVAYVASVSTCFRSKEEEQDFSPPEKWNEM